MDYKKILEGVVDIINTTEKSDIGFSNICSYIGKNCPELKESEDKKTKRILHSISSKISFHLRDIFTEEEFHCFDAWSNAWLEKQGEKKLSDKVKSRFEVGDWIVLKDLGKYKIVEVCESWYEVISYDDGIQYSISFDKEIDCYLWTIQDAKDGDVLVAEENWVFIFKRINSHGNPVCYCHWNIEFGFCIDTTSYFAAGSEIYPATKEQRDLLFQKMKEAGYEWDTEKKEPKKIEQKPVEWSEEDERLFQIVIDILDRQNHLGNISRTDLIACVRKLKSLRPQNTWKPSDEQLDALHDAAVYVDKSMFPYPKGILMKLYKQLKKLREE